ncbi:RQC-minor-1 family DNA-binding protein [Neobacillus mesonae]|uniref:RQC domain-containing protein n=1 Tax=Neobacillus mesonae TaxID=1193713 RepID=UPI00203FF621|nr:RQC-minor-1 family DNA-binding protein [Neobacillus mesonae]MCM3567615.1 superfamily II DNA helicase [Neobacillus mesonae]
MGKKINRVKYELDPMGIKSLSDDEIKIILRGADELIMTSGRSMLTKILAGSKDKKLLELELDHSPVYGAFKGTTQKEILAKIDWMILNHFLSIEYDYQVPLLVFTEKGWNIERETYAEELFEQLLTAAINEEYEMVETLKDRNRDLILLLLDKIAASGNKNFILILKGWKEIEYKKLRNRIDEVIEILEQVEQGPDKQEEETVSFSAYKKWLSIPEETRKQLERNVWCGNCLDVVQIEKYTIQETKYGIVLHGTCKTCGQEVARVID